MFDAYSKEKVSSNCIKKLADLLVKYRISRNPDAKESLEILKNKVYANFEKNPDEMKNFVNMLSNYYDYANTIDFYLSHIFAPIEPHISTKIENEYYKGSEYDTKIQDENIKITNKETNETVELDLEKITSKVPLGIRTQVKNALANLPAEVLFDFTKEIDFIENDEHWKSTAAGAVYLKDTDTMVLASADYNYRDVKDIQTIKKYIVHELGHGADFTNEKGENTPSFSDNPEYSKTYEEELTQYFEAGNSSFEESFRHSRDDHNYCTLNIKEMFAECYTLLMLGDCDSKETILKYFPKTFENVKKHIEYIRSLQQEIRHKKSE